MNDTRKFKAVLIGTGLVCLMVIGYNVFEESLISDLSAYLKRRTFYENVLSNKGLRLHKGMYWKEKE